MLVLTVAKGPDRGKVFELRDVSRVIIGRNSPDLKLNDIMISRYHAKLKRDGDRWLVRDLGSRNGTKLNGNRLVEVAILKSGDHIVTGYTEFEVSFLPDTSALPMPTSVETEDEAEGMGIGAIDVDAIEVSGNDAGAINVDADEAAIDIGENFARPAAAELSVELEAPTAEAPNEAELPVEDESPLEAELPAEVESAIEPPAVASDAEKSFAEVTEPAVTELSTDAEVVIAAAVVEPVEPALERSAIDAPAAADSDELEVPVDVDGPAPVQAEIAAETPQKSEQDEVAADAPVVAAAPPSSETVVAESGMLNLAPLDETPQDTFLLSPLPAPDSQNASPSAPLGEQAASEWMTAIEAQLVVVEEQGWDESDDDEDEFIDAQIEELEPLADDERSQLYFDEDDHWADDVQLDVDALVTSLEEDGPQALLDDLQNTPANTVTESPTNSTAKINGKRKRKRR